ncbi:MAG: threonine/serine exporter family protein [Caldilineaceae bacterium]
MTDDVTQRPTTQDQPHPAGGQRPPLDRDALREVVNLALWSGQLLMENGAESQRVEETIRSLGDGLGCDFGDVFVSYNALIVSHSSRGEFRTKTRRIGPAGVNLTLVAAMSHLRHRVEEGKFDAAMVRKDLMRIVDTPRHYNRWLTVLMVGLACAAFSRLFGGDWFVFAVTLVAASLGMWVRQELARRHLNVLLVVAVSAFVAGAVVGLTRLFAPPFATEISMAASVLLLIPGVPFVNAVEDLIKGYTAVGLARFTTSFLIILAIALGLILAMVLTGVKSL